jgi:hypothetical protein
MTAHVMARHSREHQVSCVWHPDAQGDVIETPHLGNIRVQVGPAQYQLSTGEVVTL